MFLEWDFFVLAGAEGYEQKTLEKLENWTTEEFKGMNDKFG